MIIAEKATSIGAALSVRGQNAYPPKNGPRLKAHRSSSHCLHLAVPLFFYSLSWKSGKNESVGKVNPEFKRSNNEKFQSLHFENNRNLSSELGWIHLIIF